MAFTGALWMAFIQDAGDFTALKATFPGVINGFSPEGFATAEGLNFGGVGPGGAVVYPTVLISGPSALLMFPTDVVSGPGFTWTGFILRVGGTSAPVTGPLPDLTSSCLEPDLYRCYNVMGDGDTYTPVIGGGDASLHPDGVGGYNGASWIDLGAGGGASAATIDPFDGVPLDLGAAGVEVGLGFGIQFAVNPVGLPTSFTLLWQLNGNIQVQLYGREVAGVRSYEWRRSGATVMDATPKTVSAGSWDVLGLVFEAYHLVCNVASADCGTDPFGTNNSTAIRYTDVQTGTQVVSQLGGSTGNTLDDMTFHRGGAAQTGWACAVVAYRRTGLGIADVDIPATCLLFLGQVCTVTPVDACLAFNPFFCPACFQSDVRMSPPRVIEGGTPALTVTLAEDSPPLTFDPDGIGEAVLFAAGARELTPPTVRSGAQGFPVTVDPAGLTFPASSDLTALPLRPGVGPTVNLPESPECPNPGDTGAARDDGIPYTP